MRYIHENFVSKDEIETAMAREHTINVRFCRDCPLFEPNGIQPDYPVTHGWCRRMSFYDTLEGEVPHYVHVNDSSFCNEDDIGNTEDY